MRSPKTTATEGPFILIDALRGYDRSFQLQALVLTLCRRAVNAEQQAVDSLRGYVYPTLALALAWVDIVENSLLYLEVAGDYS